MADASKTEQPTGKRLSESKGKGELPKSQEISAVMQMLAFGVVLFFMSKQMFGIMAKAFYASFDAVSSFKGLSMDTAMKYMTDGVFAIFSTVGPLFAVLTGVALVTGFLQTGFSFANQALKVDFNKINPIAGFGRMFSSHSYIELIKALMKTAVIFTIVYNIFQTEKEKIMLLAGQDMREISAYSGHLVIEVLKRIVLFLVTVAIIDIAWKKKQYMEDLKMTKEEVKEEVRQSEGDTRSKGMIKNWFKKKLRTRMIANVKRATFVSVNPTHYAVAVLYERGMKAPKLLAKGADEVAAKIREEAKAAGVPIVKNPEVTRAIYFSSEIGRYIPAKLFKAVAKILVYVYRLNKGRKHGK